MGIRLGLRSIRVRQALIAGVVLGATAVGGVAQAAGVAHIPGADGIIHACYADANGRLRVIDPLLEQCKHAETALQWNQTGPQGPQGQQGQQGPQGPQGPAGAAGAPGLSGYQQITESHDQFTLAPGTESVHVLTCPDGKKVLGGGFLLFNAGGFMSNNSNGPASDTQWAVSVFNPGSSPVTIGTVTFYAVCANVS